MRIAELRSRQRSELVEVTDSPETGELLAYFYGAKTSLRKSHSVDFGMSYVTRERDQFQGSQYAIDANLDARIPAYKAMHPDVPAQVFQVPPPRRSPRSPSGRSAAPSNSSRDASQFQSKQEIFPDSRIYKIYFSHSYFEDKRNRLRQIYLLKLKLMK